MKEVGTFWEFKGQELYYLIIGRFETYNSVVYYDDFSKSFSYTTLSEEQCDMLVPSTNLEYNNMLIEELSNIE